MKALKLSIDGLRFFEMGYGGLELEYIANWDKLFHFSLQMLVGSGTVHYRHCGMDLFGQDTDTFFILEPAVHRNLNLFTKVRMSLGTGYKYVSGVTSPITTSAELSGLSAILTVRFGKF